MNKPSIWYMRGAWWCRDVTLPWKSGSGVGETPKEAYSHWLIRRENINK